MAFWKWSAGSYGLILTFRNVKSFWKTFEPIAHQNAHQFSNSEKLVNV
jgi:hypothetical protein